MPPRRKRTRQPSEREQAITSALAAIAHEKGVTQTALSARTGVSQPLISQIFSGQRSLVPSLTRTDSGKSGLKSPRYHQEARATVKSIGTTSARATKVCAHCGADGVGTFPRGYAKADGKPLCHPDDDGPDCYHLVTVYGHPMPCGCVHATKDPPVPASEE